MSFRDFKTIECCRNCKERYLACHDHCEKYLNAKDDWINKKAKISEAKAEESIYYGFKKQQIRKDMKKYKRKGAN